jgi:probable FeS assembly SUF system protein SufT
MLSQLGASGLIEITRKTPVIEVPAGTMAALPAGTGVRVIQELGGDYTVRTRDGAMYRIDGRDADALGREVVVAPEEIGDPNADLGDEVLEAQLKKCFDPEIPINIVDLGLVYECVVQKLTEGGHRVMIKMTLTVPGCGMGKVIANDVKQKLERLPQIREAKIELVFDPPWGRDMMSEAARLQMGMF